MRNKKLTDFSLDEALLMEELLFLINSCKLVQYQHITERKDYTAKVDEMLTHLTKQGYCLMENEGSIMGEIGIGKTYYIQEKGKTICNHGGLMPIYERYKLEKSKLNISKWAIGVSILALVISLFSSKPLCDFIGSFF